jgi:hypothetical protein
MEGRRDRFWHEPDIRSGHCMSVIGSKADVPELGRDFRF